MSLTSVHTVVGRIGYAKDDVLAYIKAGYAGGKTKFSSDCPICDQSTLNLDSTYHHGYAIGAGLEWRIRPRWTLGVDYTHVDLGGHDASGTIVTGGVPSTLVSTFNSRAQAEFVGVRLNYQFDSSRDHAVAAPLK